jgi:hypothetical protein
MTRKHKTSPSVIRYRQSHPILGVVLTQDLKILIDQKKGNLSYSSFIKNILIAYLTPSTNDTSAKHLENPITAAIVIDFISKNCIGLSRTDAVHTVMLQFNMSKKNARSFVNGYSKLP